MTCKYQGDFCKWQAFLAVFRMTLENDCEGAEIFWKGAGSYFSLSSIPSGQWAVRTSL